MEIKSINVKLRCDPNPSFKIKTKKKKKNETKKKQKRTTDNQKIEKDVDAI